MATAGIWARGKSTWDKLRQLFGLMKMGSSLNTRTPSRTSESGLRRSQIAIFALYFRLEKITNMEKFATEFSIRKDFSGRARNETRVRRWVHQRLVLLAELFTLDRKWITLRKKKNKPGSICATDKKWKKTFSWVNHVEKIGHRSSKYFFNLEGYAYTKRSNVKFSTV